MNLNINLPWLRHSFHPPHMFYTDHQLLDAGSQKEPPNTYTILVDHYPVGEMRSLYQVML